MDKLHVCAPRPPPPLLIHTHEEAYKLQGGVLAVVTHCVSTGPHTVVSRTLIQAAMQSNTFQTAKHREHKEQ